MIPATAVAMRAAEQFPGEVEVNHLDALGPEVQPYGLMVTPVIVIGEDVVSTGKVGYVQGEDRSLCVHPSLLRWGSTQNAESNRGGQCDHVEVVFHTGPGDQEWEDFSIRSAPTPVVGDRGKFVGLAPGKTSLIGAHREAGLE